MATRSPAPGEGAPADDLLSIGELAARTGLTSSTLRAWERRVGFPTPVRTAGGQRRYRAHDADRVRHVLAERARGLELSAAVRAATRADTVGAGSLHATLRAAHPHLDPMRLGFPVLRSLSWSIEDECLAQASRPVLFGCFQTERSFRAASRRWRELARTSTAAVAMADFAATDPTASPAEVALPPASPMLNEWALVCLDPHLSVALVAWELPRPGTTGGPRRFEGLLSLDPEVVRDAARHCGRVAEAEGLPGAAALAGAHGDGLVEDPRRAASLLRRFATYADG